LAVFALLLEHDLSVRETEDLVRQQKSPFSVDSKIIENIETNQETQPAEAPIIHQEFKEIQDKLSVLFDMKVAIASNKKGNGKIVLHFNSLDDIHRLMTNLGF
jgi:ParB-like chromosome segregation protein Spo0J